MPSSKPWTYRLTAGRPYPWTCQPLQLIHILFCLKHFVQFCLVSHKKTSLTKYADLVVGQESASWSSPLLLWDPRGEHAGAAPEAGTSVCVCLGAGREPRWLQAKRRKQKPSVGNRQNHVPPGVSVCRSHSKAFTEFDQIFYKLHQNIPSIAFVTLSALFKQKIR